MESLQRGVTSKHRRQTAINSKKKSKAKRKGNPNHTNVEKINKNVVLINDFSFIFIFVKNCSDLTIAIFRFFLFLIAFL